MSDQARLRPLADIVELRSEKLSGRKPHDAPYLGLEHIDSDSGHLNGVGAATDSVSTNCVFLRGDILFGKLRPNLRKCVQAPFDGFGSTDILVLRPVDTIDRSFAVWVFQQEAVFRRAEQTAIGTKMPRTSWHDLKQIQVFLPETSMEQRRIAQILDALDTAIRETETLIAKLRKIKAGLLHDLLTRGIDENGELPQSGHCVESCRERAPLAEYLSTVQYGISSSLADRGAIPILRMQNLCEGRMNLTDLKYSDSLEARKLLLRSGDVLFNRTNSMEHVGRTALWRGELPTASFASYLVRLVPNHARLLPEYLNLWLNWKPTQTSIRRFATPGVQQVNINPTNLQRTVIELPKDTEEQRRIVDRLASHENAIASEIRMLEKLRALKSGLMHDLLTGRVRVPSLGTTA
jgi:type I restriction enzyme, S subunit